MCGRTRIALMGWCRSPVPELAVSDSGKRVIHFDLSDCVSTTRGVRADVPLTLRVAGESFAIKAHTPKTRSEAQGSNAALALLPAEEAHRITHFAEMPVGVLPAHSVAHLQVTAPHPNPDIQLPELLHVAFDVPEAYRQRNLGRRLAARNEVPIPPQLRRYGVQALARGSADEVWRAAGDWATPGEVATALLFHHPAMGSIDPYQAAIVIDDHIGSTQHSGVLYELAVAISRQGQSGWQTVEVATDASGRELSFGFDLDQHSEGDPVEIYSLTDETSAAMEPALAAVLRTISADERLRGRSWASEPGVAVVHQPHVQPSRGALRSQSLNWTLQNFTPDNGISAERGSISMDSSRRFSIDVKNHHLRTLGAYVQFLDDGGNPVEGFTWDTNLVAGLELESLSKKYLKVIPPRGSIMGIPVSAPQSTLSFQFPDNASAARLLFGGLGNGGWDAEVCVAGTILTGIFNYSIPTLFMVSSAGLEQTKWLSDLVSDVALQTAAMAAGAALMGEDAVPGPMDILGVFVDAIGGILVSKGLEKLAARVTAKMTAHQLAGAIPFVGWAFKAASLAAGAASLGQTIEQTVSSPATLRIDAKRTMDVRLEVTPDPEHGEAGNPDTAVWPASAARYHVTLQYRGGTTFELKGAMPETTTNEPLVLTFEDVPAGGWLQLFAGIYSENDWLCGRWQSEEVRALPPEGGGPMPQGGPIEEMLVPLTIDTQYLYKERIVYDGTAGRHEWRAGDQPRATHADASCSGIGKNICRILSVSLSNTGRQIGYSYQASDQGLVPCGSVVEEPDSQALYVFQNLSLGADPDSRLLFPSCSFTGRTLVAYDEFREEGETSIRTQNFFLDPRSQPRHLRQLSLDVDGHTVEICDGMPSWGTFPWTLIDALAFHPSGFVVGASWESDMIGIVELPDVGVSSGEPPAAALVGGRGQRAGSLAGARALTVMPDGRIMVLESINKRVQAFDTRGNVVPSFDGERVASLEGAHAADLDAAEFTGTLHDAFQAHELTPYRCDIDQAFGEALDRGELSDDLRDELALEGMQLSRDPEQPEDPAANAAVEVVEPNRAWRIVDLAQERSFAIELRDSRLVVRDEFDDVVIEIREPGADWVLTDRRGGEAFHLLRDPAQSDEITVLAYRSFMPLVEPGEQVEILDIAAEAKGYLYVLSYRGDGRAAEDYDLDIYEPNGRFLTRTTGVNGARIAVDAWRSLFVVTFDVVEGPGGRTEPTLAHWFPSPPDPE